MNERLKTVLMIIGLIILYLGLALLEAWIIAKLICFGLGLTYTTTLFWRIAAVLIIINILRNIFRRPN